MTGHRTLTWIAAVLAVAVAALGVWKGSFVAGAADAYGYVSEADLIAHGSMSVEQQFVRTLPWPFADWSFAPAGYRPATARGFIVPTYPAGVPIVMAMFERVGGRNAVFYVVPLLGGLAVWMTFVLGSAIHSELTGFVSALLLATSPSFVVELLAPASDVAATAWWATALAATLHESAWAAAAAGLAASMAVLTRPNLLALFFVVAAFFAVRTVRPDRRRTAADFGLFVLAAIPGCIAVAAINQHLYGSPLRSGYESLGALFQWSNAAANLDRYPRWLLQTQTPFIAIGALAPIVIRTRRHVWLLLAFAATVCASYLFYRPFGRDEWTYLRFLLPAYPALLVLAVAVTIDLARRLVVRPAKSIACALAVCAAVIAWQASDAIRLGALNARAVDRRYVDVGRYVETMLPANTLCIARLHAGSIRYYAGRLTLYYDWLQPRWLDDAVGELTRRGYHPVIVVEADEEPGFRERFGDLNRLGRLDWPPAAELAGSTVVRIYDPGDWTRSRRGEQVATRTIARWPRFR